MTYRGKVQGGVIVLEGGATLPEGELVEVATVAARATPPEDGPTLYEMLKPFIGAIKDMPSDLAENHDHYAHGAPKRRPTA